ncbi:MAG: crotonase/enoyl-CoA hydratase family protein [Alphaproteobacteria bacterium]|nr:crotonase/enoyl-CoA hydratase family protein [Alphaproteobacteria bacterium]
MNDRVTVTIDQGVADVRMVRADKMNALDDAMFGALIDAGTRLKTERGLRAVVLSGEGKAFCAGLDMGNFQRTADAGSDPRPGGRLLPRTNGIANRPQYAAWVWREVPVPVIAAVHGVAFGGGFQVMLGADMRFVAPDTKLSVMEIKWGLVPDMAGTLLMRNLLRDDVIRDLTYTGRIFLAEEGERLGLVTRLTATPREYALAAAREIAMKNPDAIRAAKRLLNASHLVSDADGLMSESREQDALGGKPNQIEAVMAQMQKRPPNFKTDY